MTPESRWWPACWHCFHSGRPCKVECIVPLADARRMLSESASLDVAEPALRLAPGRAFPSIAFRPAEQLFGLAE